MKTFLFLLILVTSFCYAQQDESWKLYDDSQVSRIDITVDTASLNWIYNHVESDSDFYAVIHFKNSWIDETVDSIGFRIRGNTSRDAKKKSFKISFNTFNHDKEFYSVDALNLNGEHNDPSIIRSKLCFDHFKSIGLPASRATHIEVYINNRYYGLYISVEHVDKKFLKKNFPSAGGNLWKCLYPADLQYLGNNPQTYIDLSSSSRKVYELTTNEDQNDFTGFVRFISILNNTPINQLADSLEQVLDVPGVLKYFATNILTGSWDDYWSLMNNYYLYSLPGNGIFHIIPYDYDNTFGVDWSGNNWTTANPYNFPKVASGATPLAERLLSVPQYRNLFTHILEYYRAKGFLLSNWESKIDSIHQMITPFAIPDTFRTKDYGFTVSDFNNSYSATGYSNQQVKYGLKQYVNLRNSSLPGQLSYQTANPFAYKIDFEPANPGPGDSVRVYVSAFSATGLKNVSIYFTKSGTTTPQIIPMIYSPITASKKVEDADRYVGIISPLGSNGSGYFSIYLQDSVNYTQTYPRSGPINISAPGSSLYQVVINEFMADNKKTIADANGEYDDWLELYNSSTTKVLLTGKYLTDNPSQLSKWRFTQDSLYINPEKYILIWCDDQESQPGIHTNFKLSKSGEYIALVDTNGKSVIDSITFYAQQTDISYGRSPDGSTNWEFMTPTPGYSNLISSIRDENNPAEYMLIQNYPNPFNPSTRISFSVAKQGHVSLKIYNILGEIVTTLVNEVRGPGNYSVSFDAHRLSSGIYFYELNTGNFRDIKKMVILK
jgi:hypothetical protein